jgi:hypothetical protein
VTHHGFGHAAEKRALHSPAAMTADTAERILLRAGACTAAYHQSERSDSSKRAETPDFALRERRCADGCWIGNSLPSGEFRLALAHIGQDFALSQG